MLKINLSKLIYKLFDISLLIYLIAYYVYFQEGETNSRIRLIGTLSFYSFGIILMIFKKEKRLYNMDHYLRYSCFIAFGILSIIWAKDFTLITSILRALLRVLIILLLVSIRIENREDFERILFFHVLAVIYLNIYILKKMIGFYGINDFIFHRLGDNFGYNSNLTANMNAIAILICIYFTRIKNNKKFYLLFIVLSLGIILLTGSKQGIISLLLGVFIFFYYRGNIKEKLNVIIISIIIFLFIINILINIPIFYKIIGHRFETMFHIFGQDKSTDVSTLNRDLLINQAFSIWQNNILFGVGLNNFAIVQNVRNRYYYAHNNYLELLADVGIIGFVLYYLNFYYIFKKKVNRKDDLQILMKSIFWCIVFIDFAVITYQDYRYQMFLYLCYISLSRQKIFIDNK